MDRRAITPRTGWEQKVESVGLTYHHTVSPAGAKHLYWDESAYYRFSMAEVDTLERATNELHQLCLAAAQHIIDHDRFDQLSIPKAAVPLIRQAWDAEPPAIYGRFDLAFDGVNPPKLLEYNADTPTSLVEAAVIQWFWLQDLDPRLDQFNSLHERLVAAWGRAKAGLPLGPLAFLHQDEVEDVQTVAYLRDTADQAGLATVQMPLEDLGWDERRRCFVAPAERPLTAPGPAPSWSPPGKCCGPTRPCWRCCGSSSRTTPTSCPPTWTAPGSWPPRATPRSPCWVARAPMCAWCGQDSPPSRPQAAWNTERRVVFFRHWHPSPPAAASTR